jgi:hypothetical protein
MQCEVKMPDSKSKKVEGIQEFSPVVSEELPSKVYVPSDLDKEQMYQEYRRGNSLKSIAEKWNLTEKSLQKYKKDYKWEARKAKDLEEKQMLEKADVEHIARETYSRLLKVVYKLVTDFEKYVFEGEDTGRPVPLKILTDAVEKLTKLHYFAANGGVERTKSEHTVRNVNERIDYAKLAEIHLKMKQLNPGYDEKALLKDVVDAAYKKNE